MVSGATLYLPSGRKLFQAHRDALPVIAFGIAGIIVWILLSKSNVDEAVVALLPVWLQPDQRLAFNPFATIPNPLFQ